MNKARLSHDGHSSQAERRGAGVTNFEAVGVVRSQLGESPCWLADEAALVWTDIPACRVHRWHASVGVETFVADEAIGSLAPTASGGFVAATETGFSDLVLRGGKASLSSRAAILAHDPALRMNDGRCDRLGRFWAASMAWTPDPSAPVGRLYRHDPDGTTAAMAGDLIVPNGIAFSPAGDRLYLADSHVSRAVVWSFAIDSATGSLGGRQLFADFAAIGGRPDGAAIDVEGGYWSAAADVGRLYRFDPDGRLTTILHLPMSSPTMPCFGGEGLRTLFITSLSSARPKSAPDHLGCEGAVIQLAAPVSGLAETPFGGAPA